jgi:hypothetical protein
MRNFQSPGSTHAEGRHGKSMDEGISLRATSDDDLKSQQGGDRNQVHGRTERWRRPGRGKALRYDDRRLKQRKTSSSHPPLYFPPLYCSKNSTRPKTCPCLKTELNFIAMMLVLFAGGNTNERPIQKINVFSTHSDFLPCASSIEYLIQCTIHKGFCIPIHGRNINFSDLTFIVIKKLSSR